MGAAPGRTPSFGLGASERRVLNPRPFRVFRKTYSTGEAKAGAAVFVLLAAIAAWVAWRGANPDPGLFADPALLAPGATSQPADAARRAPDGPSVPLTGYGLPTTDRSASSAGGSAPVSNARHGLPSGLASSGWTEGPVTRFDAENLYVKIDGRADFFLARGFRSLTFVTVSGPGGAAVDVELYDLGSAENALGAFAAEKPPEAKPASAKGTSWYVARNALFVARGTSYTRAIGSDETPAVLGQLETIRKAIEGGIAAGERPWAAALFGDALGLPADRLQYAAENAFSFGFAKNVSSATLDDGETELFVLPAGGEAKAKSLADEFEKGFLSYGERVEVSGAGWVKDRYLSTYARALAAGTMVVGVKGAADPAAAGEALAKLEKAVRALPPEVPRRAAAAPPPAAKAKAKGGGYE